MQTFNQKFLALSVYSAFRQFEVDMKEFYLLQLCTWQIDMMWNEVVILKKGLNVMIWCKGGANGQLRLESLGIAMVNFQTKIVYFLAM